MNWSESWIQTGCQRTIIAETHYQYKTCSLADEVSKLPNTALGLTKAMSVNWSPALITRLIFPFHPINLLNITVRFNLSEH